MSKPCHQHPHEQGPLVLMCCVYFSCISIWICFGIHIILLAENNCFKKDCEQYEATLWAKYNDACSLQSQSCQLFKQSNNLSMLTLYILTQFSDASDIHHQHLCYVNGKDYLFYHPFFALPFWKRNIYRLPNQNTNYTRP